MSDDPFRLGLDRFADILPRYATEGPRYTSGISYACGRIVIRPVVWYRD